MKKKSSSLGVGRRRVLKGAALVCSAALTPRLAANAQVLSKVTLPMSDNSPGHATNDLTADEIRKLLQLEPNATCGFVRVTYESKQSIAAGVLPAPFAEKRPLGSALYFMVTPGAPVRLHRIRNAQLYHYYLGDPLELFLLHTDGAPERIIVGSDIRNGQRVQLLIPGNTFHTARLLGQGRWFLGASTEWPGVIPADVELANWTNWRENIPQSPPTCAPLPGRSSTSISPGLAQGARLPHPALLIPL